MRFIPFDAAHIEAFEAQEAQRELLKWHSPEIAQAASQYFSFTGLDERGRYVGCAGLAPAGDVLVAWAVFSPLIFAHGLAVTKAVKRGLDLHRGRTIQALVDVSHVKAARFAEALQFKLKETRTDLHPSGCALHVFEREASDTWQTR